MIVPILVFLVLFAVHTYVPGTLRYVMGPMKPVQAAIHAMGPRDELPPLGPAGARAQRALANLQESTPAFLALSLLHQLQTPDPTAVLAAWGFLAARTAYLPLYMAGIPGLRSTAWSVAVLCLITMGVTLL